MTLGRAPEQGDLWHSAIDPDSEMITAAAVTAANVGDGSVAKELLADVIAPSPAPTDEAASAEDSSVDAPEEAATAAHASPPPNVAPASEPVEVYGDASYGTTAHLMRRRHGGRRARTRGTQRIGQDFMLLCAATNLHRLAQFGLRIAPVNANAARA